MKLEVIKEKERSVFTFSAPAKLSDLLTLHEVPLRMPCGGRRSCLKCKIKVHGALSPMGAWESELLTDKEKAEGIRFACMAQALGDVEVELPRNRLENIITEGVLPQFDIEPWAEGYGVAVDIGTTTVAAYLYALADGRLLDSISELNPQGSFGADVISRLEKSLAGSGKALAKAVRGSLSRLTEAMCSRAEVSVESIGNMVITGNTAMLYLLCGDDPSSITAAPFRQSRYFGEFISPATLDLPLRKDARVYLSRSISAYVGGDITSALLAARFHARNAAPELLADIGTNGEIALMAGGNLLCCSTAAGPAFEGTGIYRGMTAGTGAVYRVDLAGDAMQVAVFGDVEAEGVCGSGIVDAIAAMLDAGVLDETGCILEEGHAFERQVRDVDGQPAFVLPGTQVEITQKDVRAVQLAKSAIHAGMVTLLQEAGIAPEEIKNMLIAGGFGSCIRPRSAERIGLIPRGFAEKAVSIGNAAGAGASMMLLSEHFLHESENLSISGNTVELSTNPIFMDAYIEGMMFL